MVDSKQVIQALQDAIECSLALDMRYNLAVDTLAKHGWNHSDRFAMSASHFVKQKQEQALELAKQFEREQ